MALGIRQSFKILAPGGSLRRRVAYSLVIVRVILAPVILLAVYYLFEMGRIVDRIVNVDAARDNDVGAGVGGDARSPTGRTKLPFTSRPCLP